MVYSPENSGFSRSQQLIHITVTISRCHLCYFASDFSSSSRDAGCFSEQDPVNQAAKAKNTLIFLPVTMPPGKYMTNLLIGG